MQLVSGCLQGCRLRWRLSYLLANFLYSPPGLLKIAEAEAQLPGWLFADYRAIYEQMDQTPVATVQSQQPVQPSTELSPPDFGVFPQPFRN